MDEALRVEHNVILEGRKRFNLSGIRDVISFDEETVMLDTSQGRLAIKGEGIHILNFNNTSGDLSGEGRIHAFIYTAEEKGEGFFARMFR